MPAPQPIPDRCRACHQVQIMTGPRSTETGQCGKGWTLREGCVWFKPKTPAIPGNA
ncbi:MAG: hypothetical protein JSR28_06310 [Proteobacteria bacterium]|nr:hypothetical protein [Pseudomonadota bacterium]